MSGPSYATAFTIYTVLKDNSGVPLTTPTIAVGDVQIQKDLGTFANTTNAPVLTNGTVSVTLTVTEMTAAQVRVRFKDAAGAEWLDQDFHLLTE